MDLLIKKKSVRNSSLTAHRPVDIDKQQACQFPLTVHNTGRSVTCAARHNARQRVRCRVFLIRYSLCFKNVAAVLPVQAGNAAQRRPARFSACIYSNTECDKSDSLA
jgi:hypothetical protein